ncbi:Uncharacterised protein [Bordetella pertussis]|nr:Uncharacterised protein [Bordetella pertussis]
MFRYCVPSSVLTSKSLTEPGRKSLMPILPATHLAVAGISCIKPDAPACERASMMKRDSWRIRPYTQAGSRSMARALALTRPSKGAMKRWLKSNCSAVRSEVLTTRS